MTGSHGPIRALQEQIQWEKWLGGNQDVQQSLADALAAAHRAVEIDDTDAKAHEWVAWVLLFVGRVDAALAEVERSIELSPNNAQAHCVRGIVHCVAGRPEEGAEKINLAIQLSPRDWLRFQFVHTLWVCQYNMREYTAAADTAMKLVALKPDYMYGHWGVAISCAQLGQTARAQSAFRQVLRLKPDFDRAFVESVAPFKDPADLEHLIDGLRKAG